MKRFPAPRADQPAAYRIVARGRFGENWAEWLDGVTVTTKEDAVTVAAVVDQAALRAILNRLWDLNLTLVSAVRTEDGTTSKE